jgi:two-component system capsular synthesis sensor histidine kinase RcsC
MPDEDGLSLLRRVRAEHGDMPAIAVSAFSGPSEMHRISSAGFDGHIKKPIALEELTSTIAGLVGARSAGEHSFSAAKQEVFGSVLAIEDDPAMSS